MFYIAQVVYMQLYFKHIQYTMMSDIYFVVVFFLYMLTTVNAQCQIDEFPVQQSFDINKVRSKNDIYYLKSIIFITKYS